MYQSGDYIAGLILGDSLSNQSGLDVNENENFSVLLKSCVYITGLILGSKGDSLSNQSGLDVNENDNFSVLLKV